MKDEYVSDISFIIVAKNEEFGIKKCLNSLKDLPLIACEVICVDSGSDDSTLEVMKGFVNYLPDMKIYKCSGYCNSAIARNVGLGNASKELIFFIDGDIEVNYAFVKKAYYYLKNGICEAITGQLGEIYYDEEYKKEIRHIKDRFRINEEEEIYNSGGCFMVKSSILSKVGLWDERMERNQDIEYTLRLSRFGRFIAIPTSMGVHHTQEFNHRPLYFLKKCFPMFFGMLIRKNIDRPNVLIQLMKQNRGYLIGIPLYFFIFMFGIGQVLDFEPFNLCIFAILFILTIDISNCLLHKKNIFNQFLVHYVYPLFIIIGFFIDYIGDNTSTQVQQVYGDLCRR